jgi:hypothetical protein
VLLIVLAVAFPWYLGAQAPELPAGEAHLAMFTQVQIISILLSIAAAFVSTVAFLFIIGLKLCLLKPDIIQLIKERGKFVSPGDDLCREVRFCLADERSQLAEIRKTVGGGPFLTQAMLLQTLLLEILDPEPRRRLRQLLLDDSEVGRMVERSLQERLAVTANIFGAIRSPRGARGQQ